MEEKTAGVDRRSKLWCWFVLGSLMAAFSVLASIYANFYPAHSRFYDERFALQNVHSVLQLGKFQPANGYYPTLSYMPQTLVLAAVEAGGQALTGKSWIYRAEEPPPANVRPPQAGTAFTPLAYKICRGIQILWSLATLALLFLLARYCFDWKIACLAVAILATCPWFVTAAAKFKPDASLLATTLLALWLGCRAVEREADWRAYLATGAAIAAAMSCKLTGGVVAIPFALVSFMQARSEIRRLVLLCAGGLFSLVLFLLFNPHLRLYLNFMGRLTAEYEGKARAYGGTHLGVIWRSLDLVVSQVGFGILFGGLALLGFLVIGGLLVVRRQTFYRPALLLIWLFPPLYLAIFAAKTPHFKGNNVLSILPPLAIFGSWLTVLAWRRLRIRLSSVSPSLPSPALAAGLLGTTLYLGFGVWTYVYQSVVPTTQDLAMRWLKAELGQRRPLHLIAEARPTERYRWEGASLGRALILARFPLNLQEIHDGFNITDGFLGAASSLKHSSWKAALPGSRTARFAPSFLTARGEQVSVVARPWRAQGAPVQAMAERSGDRLVLKWPEEVSGGWYSLEVWIPLPVVDSLGRNISIADARPPLIWLRKVGQGHLFTSSRFVYDSQMGPPPIALEIPSNEDPAIEDAVIQKIAFALYRWHPPS